MEESVALDSSQQKQFVKSVRGIKKLLKKKGKPPQKPVATKTEKKVVIQKKEPVGIVKKNKVKRRKPRGLVYLSHIPHGFYEHQMTEYFKQFGVVTNARVIRSRRTGNSKGYAFVEFKDLSVAQIVAETMNNYLMGKRLIKAVYIPPKKQKIHALRKNWNFQNNPASKQRMNIRKAYNASKSSEAELKIARNILASISKTKRKLRELGIDYDFFQPVDVPEALKELTEKVECSDKKEESKDEKKTKKKVKSEPNEIKIENNENKSKIGKKENNTDKVKNKKEQLVNLSGKSNATSVEKSLKDDQNKPKTKIKNEVKNENQQQNKNKKETEQNIKPLESFIRVKTDSSSEDDEDFDSDEFEKMLENDDDEETLSNDESVELDEESDDYGESDEEDSDHSEEVKKEVKGNKINISKNSLKNAALNAMSSNARKGKPIETRQSVKRSNVQNAAVVAKKAKFEKQKKPFNKVVKKKK